MRKIIIIALLAVVGLMTTTEASAQFDLSRALNSLLGAERADAEPAKSPYAVIAESAPQASKLTGVWLYNSAAVDYLGTSPLADVALSQLEGYALAELRGAGVLPGYFGLTLRRNGVAYLSHEDQIFEGRYRYNPDDASVVIEATINNTPMSLGGYIKQESTRMEVLIDAEDAMSLFLELFPEYNTNSMVVSANSVIKTFGDIYISIRFTR